MLESNRSVPLKHPKVMITKEITVRPKLSIAEVTKSDHKPHMGTSNKTLTLFLDTIATAVQPSHNMSSTHIAKDQLHPQKL